VISEQGQIIHLAHTGPDARHSTEAVIKRIDQLEAVQQRDLQSQQIGAGIERFEPLYSSRSILAVA
jgi:hypothetical protein